MSISVQRTSITGVVIQVRILFTTVVVGEDLHLPVSGAKTKQWLLRWKVYGQFLYINAWCTIFAGCIFMIKLTVWLKNAINYICYIWPWITVFADVSCTQTLNIMYGIVSNIHTIFSFMRIFVDIPLFFVLTAPGYYLRWGHTQNVW